jgi:hypothetical protein
MAYLGPYGDASRVDLNQRLSGFRMLCLSMGFKPTGTLVGKSLDEMMQVYQAL